MLDIGLIKISPIRSDGFPGAHVDADYAGMRTRLGRVNNKTMVSIIAAVLAVSLVVSAAALFI